MADEPKPVVLHGVDDNGNFRRILATPDGGLWKLKIGGIVEIEPTILVDPNDTSATVDSTSSIIVPANPNREELLLVNDSAVKIYIGLGHAAVVGSGPMLMPNGGKGYIGKFNLFLGAIHAIAGTDGNNICISETPPVP